MENPLTIEVNGSDGSKHTCRLVDKHSNENGQLVYTFRDEHTHKDFLICKHGDHCEHLLGDLPGPDSINELSEYIAHLETDKL